MLTIDGKRAVLSGMAASSPYISPGCWGGFVLAPLRLIRRLRALLGRRRFDADVEEELRVHLDMEAAKHAARGVPGPAAETWRDALSAA